MTSDEQTRQKRAAAERAVALVESGMVVGLGAGSTAMFAIERLGARLARGELVDVRCVPASIGVGAVATRLGIALTTLETNPVIDLTIDGADEIDPQLSAIKGGGGALLREKIIAQASRREVLVVDASKLSPMLGTKHSVPVEVAPFGWRSQQRFLESLGARASLRLSPTGAPYRTDQDNHIVDCMFGPIREPETLARALSARAGIVEHGLFLGLATDVLIADATGVRHETGGERR
ncbi:MAG: ribose-5-phosphate isomerase RpiA [Kofleriaceae bacterium]|nr:ribose-5-phosphate isomerase RpiA [Kofleriaceae bacterium]